MEYSAQQGNINRLYNSIAQNPHVLEEIDSIPFVETPLHVAAREGNVEFCNEIITLKPSFLWKFNSEGRRPVHLALESDHTRMVLHLIQMNKELVQAKMKGGLTLLHMASQRGDINLLSELLNACPNSVKDLTAKNETALYFAVKYKRFEAFGFLLSWLKTNTVELQRILNQKDVEGNTILHIAATMNNTEVMKLLIEVMTDIDAVNLMGEKALNIIDDQKIKNNLVRAEISIKRFRKFDCLTLSMHEWLIRTTGMKENLSNDIRNAYMIVATLIATTTYQAVLSPPGGFHQIDASGTNNTLILAHGSSNSSKVYEGKSVMSDSNFRVFSITNALAFLTSIITIIYLMPRNVGWSLLCLTTWLLLISYSVSMDVISPNDITANILSYFYLVLLPVLIVACFLFFKRSLM